MKPEKSPFEINWPLADSKLVENSAGSMWRRRQNEFDVNPNWKSLMRGHQPHFLWKLTNPN